MTIEVVDPTRLNDSLDCLRLYYWRHERSIVPNAPRLPLAYGGGAHHTLAQHYRGESAGVSLKAFDEIWEKEVETFVDENTEEDAKRNPVRWAEVFAVYRQQYKNEPFKVLFVEAPFFLPLNDKIALAGILDLLVEYLGQKMIMDHKTTYTLDTKFLASFNPNHQFSSYLLGGSELLGEPITTLLVNCILTHAKEMRPEKLFARVPTTRSPSQHQMLKEEIIGWWSIVQDCRRTGNWPRNPSRCQKYGQCEYHPLCTDIQTDYRRIIPSKLMYRESQWDPILELRDAGFKETI